MRPYRRKFHSTWRTRRTKGVIGGVTDYLKPFVYSTKAIWKLEPPFPLTAKIFITALTWFLLFLPLCYFLVPPLAALLLINYFSHRINLDRCVTRLGEFCARVCWPKKLFFPFRFLDRLTIAFFLYDYYQILKCLRSD
ncbi:hypothetical protein RUM43_001782 [Polyplax serrata]|uniref:Uncharacterized protein n=1 Tax=Polyplax serrata TaxID=468196 RepID=A0AAN8XRD0_POLSC